MNVKKILVLSLVALVLYCLITKPEESADAVQNALDWLRTGAAAIVVFLRTLFG